MLPKLVFLTSRFPYPLEKGDKLRAYYQIRALSKHFSIHLIALSDQEVAQTSIDQLKTYCDTIQVYQISKFSTYLHSFIALLGSKPIQVGYFYNYFIHRKIKQEIRKINPTRIFTQLIRTTEYTKEFYDIPKILDYMDAFSKGIERRINDSPLYLKWFFKTEHKRLVNYEQKMFDYFEHHIIISEQDKSYIMHPDRERIVCLPNGIDQHFFENNRSETKYDLAFVGNMSYPPNIEASLFIIEEILPELPKLKLLIAGAKPHPKLVKAASNNSNITISGWIEDIREAYQSARIFFAPMKTGTGMQNKLLEAMALGVPCITTPLANNAIRAVNHESILVCNSKEEMITQINQLLNHPNFATEIGEKGSDFVKANYSWENVNEYLASIAN